MSRLKIRLKSLPGLSRLILISALLISTAVLAGQRPEELKDVGIVEHLGAQISIGDLNFRDEQGTPVVLSNYFKKGRPVILNLVYYECPNLCTLVLSGLVKSLRDLQWTPGKEFEIVTVSINPLEGADLATQKKKAYLESYGRPEAAAGWHFLTGSEANIKKLASQVGFLYKYDNEAQQYAHTAAIFALTPEGKISRYLYGIDFQVRDLKLSMLEASNGQIGSTIDRFLLFCYRYDPKTKKYSVYITDFLRAGSAVTVFLFGGYLFAFWRRQGRRKLENVEMSDERGES